MIKHRRFRCRLSVRRHRQSCADTVDPPDTASTTAGAHLSPTGGHRIYASPGHLHRPICPSSNHHHLYCDKYEATVAAAASAHWFDPAAANQLCCGKRRTDTTDRVTLPAAANQLCWNQTIKFVAPSDDELIATHEPYALDRNWTAVTGGGDPVNL